MKSSRYGRTIASYYFAFINKTDSNNILKITLINKQIEYIKADTMHMLALRFPSFLEKAKNLLAQFA
jgi:hypothetical protein